MPVITTRTTIAFKIPEEYIAAREFQELNPSYRRNEVSSAIYFSYESTIATQYYMEHWQEGEYDGKDIPK